MDYEKEYKDALKRAKEFMSVRGVSPYEDALECAKELSETIFPQLAESEDEKVRKALIEMVHDTTGDSLWIDYNVHKEDALAWLEKQGEQNNDKIVEKAKTEKQRVLLTETDGSANIDWDCRSLDDVKTLLKCGLEFIRTIEINKQILADNRFGGCSIRVPTRYDKGIKQVKQIPADKVEPKFKEGNWYQCTKDFFGKGVTFDKNTAYYCAKEGCLQNEYGCHIAIVKDLYDNFKLWTIQDAKDGDVLATEGFVFIFKEIREDKGVGYFCANENALHEGDDNTFHIANPNSLMGSINNDFTHYTPATKEQRDTLEKAITNAGYRWDKEKLKLEKV
jgi:hypothetical protein